MENEKSFAWLGVAAAVALGASVAYYRYRAAPAPGWSSPAPAPQALEAPAAVALPGLEESDALARERAKGLFAGAGAAGWLSGENLLRRAASAVRLVAEGKSPREALSFLRPAKRFAVKKAGGRLYADPRCYQRYDGVAEAVASLDAAAAAATIRELKPLLQQACAEIEETCDFQASLLLSIMHLLETPVPAGDLLLREKVITFAIVDENLESLSPAQKHLLRMGPQNQAKVQAKLRELALALGAAPAKLPKP